MPYIIDSITAETINVNQELKVNGIPITPSGGGGSFTGGTVTGQTQFTNGLTATTISATTYQNLPGGGIEGSNYIYVAANGTDTENATELQTAYTTAVGLSPSATNRITIVCGPGYYNFGSSAFVMDTQYIDLVSLDGNRSVIFNSSNAGGTISITANNVFVKGVDVGTKNFTIATSLNLLKVENCVGGIFSFGGDDTYGSNPITVSGTFTNCVGGTFSFGGIGTASGTFTDCVGGESSFGSYGTASGIFTNCVGGVGSFGSGGTVSGTFTNCTGGDYSFGGENIGGSGTVSGTFTNCVGGNFSFGGGYGGTVSGTFTNCVGGERSFGGGGAGTVSGTFTNCTGGERSFGGGGGVTVSGTFNSCTGGNGSFGGSGVFGVGTLSGKLYYCRLTSGSFQTVSGGGITRLCLDGSNVENNQG